jgi:hypothetical protein
MEPRENDAVSMLVSFYSTHFAMVKAVFFFSNIITKLILLNS